MLTVFHADWSAWRSEFASVLGYSSLGAGLGSLFAIPILWRSDVRRSVPFVWFSTVLLMALSIAFESQLSRSSFLLWIPWTAMVVGMFVARRLFGPTKASSTAVDSVI
ncbi:MAG: hypothetical protein KDC14_12690 [Planctomycetes bacterium]|nr:hypothetical protein [Planctomycetota bacterium]